jgi:pimeloyl-ACP methyl ester carboxylesterase
MLCSDVPSGHSIRASRFVRAVRAGATRTCALAVAAFVPAAAAAQQPAVALPLPETGASSFTVFIRGVPIGSEQATIARTAEGWTIVSSGRMGSPVDLVERRVQVRYTADWKPLELTVDATVRGQALTVHTIVTGTTAATQFTQAGQSGEKTDAIAADAVLLPSPFWGPFEALSLKARTAAPGTTISGYALQTSLSIEVGESSSERVQTVARLIEVRRTALKMTMGSTPLDAQIWSDETGRLLRLTIPAQQVDVVREDIASVSSRSVPISRGNDEQVRIPANGFSLAGTLSKPAASSPAPLPAVVLVGGSGPTDRDELVFGIPVLGQIAAGIADAGFMVLRYDKRGVGQSGGRLESAGFADYAEDLRAAVKFLADRKDVDGKRIGVIGHSEGGAVALMAAAKDKRIAALLLIAANGVTGAELILQQQEHLLGRAKISDAEKEEKIALQKKIHNAVITGKGWEEVPPALRKQVDNPEFQSLLTNDPAKTMPDVRQPILIVQGELDTQVAPSNADRLEALARKRKNAPPVQVVKVPGVNHLLVAETTGEVEEYASLPDKHVSPAVIAAVVAWLQKTLAAPAR